MPQIELVSVPMNNPHWIGIKVPINITSIGWISELKHSQIV